MTESVAHAEKTIDFAIVGGGVAGAYIAWRLANAPLDALRSLVPKGPERPAIHLYERTGRLGGRLLTVDMPGTTALKAELGGMRYASSQLLVSSLVKQLNLASRPFEFATRLMYLRGHHFKPYSAVPYKLKADEQTRAPDELVKYALRCALAEIEFEQKDGKLEQIRDRLHVLKDENEELRISILKPWQWRLLKEFAILQGSRLSEIGFWNLLAYYLSSEAFLFAHDGLGYESILANWNAAEAIPWFLSDFGVEYLTLDRGMESLSTALDFNFRGSSQESSHTQREVHLRHELVSVQQVVRSDENLLRLEFAIDGKTTQPMLARHLILALPKKPLREETNLMQLPGFNKREWHALLDSVTPHALFKLFLGYERAWWEDPRALGHESGRISTDLPIRQVYYFGKEVGGTSRGMLMASYSDAHYVDFWDPLLVFPGRQFYYKGETPLESGGKEESILRLYGATERMVRKAHRQIVQLHPEVPRDSIPKPYVALVMNWSRGPYDYGGWHTWKVNTTSSQLRPWEVRKKLMHPLDVNLYVCGEAYSCEQGWVEGALRSAEMVLHELKIPVTKGIREARYEAQGFKNHEEYLELATPTTE